MAVDKGENSRTEEKNSGKLVENNTVSDRYDRIRVGAQTHGARSDDSPAFDLLRRVLRGEAEGRGGGGVGGEGAEGGKRGTDTEKAVAPDGREGGERLRVKRYCKPNQKFRTVCSIS